MKLIISLLAFVLLTAGPLAVLAQTTNPGPGPGTTNPNPGPGTTNPDPEPGTTNPAGRLVNPLGSIDSLEALLGKILEAVVEIGAIILVLAIIYVGFKFVAAQGAEEKIKEARAALVWTVIGGLILLGAQAITMVIQETVKAL